MFILSIGHHPDAKGATNGDYNEFDLACQWAERIEQILGPKDIGFKLAPVGRLEDKVKFINNTRHVQFAAELHFNANITGAQGSETLYYPGSNSGRKYANMIQNEYERRNIFQPNRGAKEGYYFNSDGTKSDEILYFLRATKVPSVIIEPEFMSNMDRINDYWYEGCDAIIQATLKFHRYLNHE